VEEMKEDIETGKKRCRDKCLYPRINYYRKSCPASMIKSGGIHGYEEYGGTWEAKVL
jgi:hypothetical protein